MMVHISHSGKTDLIVQTSGNQQYRIRPMRFWERWLGRDASFPIGDNELIVLRTDLAREPQTGAPLRNVV